ncbi:MAG: DUF2330 domain-containing protein [Chthonomonadaceae bacterium]|nr:DUF2330 domain-containing protein [Chthonomonadaceae bacterium]
MRTLALVAVLILSKISFPCCMASDGSTVKLVGEQVVIVWDADKKIEHFVRKATFDTSAKDFGFIVPTPSVPTLAVAKTDIFGKLKAYVDFQNRPPSIACSAPLGSVDAAAGGVEVVSEQTVGDYKAAIIRASDASGLGQWLKANGYVSRPAMEEWFDHYIKKNWVFTALKYTGKKGMVTATQAVRISFKTDAPHYPYKMPKDTWPAGWYRPLSVYFISTSDVRGDYLGKGSAWEARKRWSGSLNQYMVNKLLTDLNLKGSDMPKHPVLTQFDNSRNAIGYDDDLVFRPQEASILNPTTLAVGAIIGSVWMIHRRRRKTV